MPRSLLSDTRGTAGGFCLPAPQEFRSYTRGSKDIRKNYTNRRKDADSGTSSSSGSSTRRRPQHLIHDRMNQLPSSEPIYLDLSADETESRSERIRRRLSGNASESSTVQNKSGSSSPSSKSVNDRSLTAAMEKPWWDNVAPNSPSQKPPQSPTSTKSADDQNQQLEQIFFVAAEDGGSVMTGMSQQELLRKKARSESKKRKGLFSKKKKRKNPIISLPPALLAGAREDPDDSMNNFYSSSSMPSSAATPERKSRSKDKTKSSSPMSASSGKSWKVSWGIDEKETNTTAESTFTESIPTIQKTPSMEAPFSSVPKSWAVVNEAEGESFIVEQASRQQEDHCSIDEYSFPLLSTGALGGIHHEVVEHSPLDDEQQKDRVLSSIPENYEYELATNTPRSDSSSRVRFAATAELSTIVPMDETGGMSMETDHTGESDYRSTSYMSYQIDLDSPTAVADILNRSTGYQPTPTKMRRIPRSSASPVRSILRPGKYGDRNGNEMGGLKKAYIRAMSYWTASQVLQSRRPSYEDEEVTKHDRKSSDDVLRWVPAVSEDEPIQFVDPSGRELSPIRENRSSSVSDANSKSEDWSEYEDSETMQRLNFIEAVAAVVIQTGYRRYRATKHANELRRMLVLSLSEKRYMEEKSQEKKNLASAPAVTPRSPPRVETVESTSVDDICSPTRSVQSPRREPSRSPRRCNDVVDNVGTVPPTCETQDEERIEVDLLTGNSASPRRQESQNPTVPQTRLVDLEYHLVLGDEMLDNLDGTATSLLDQSYSPSRLLPSENPDVVHNSSDSLHEASEFSNGNQAYTIAATSNEAVQNRIPEGYAYEDPRKTVRGHSRAPVFSRSPTRLVDSSCKDEQGYSINPGDFNSPRHSETSSKDIQADVLKSPHSETPSGFDQGYSRSPDIVKAPRHFEMPSSDEQEYSRIADLIKSSQLSQMPSSDKQGNSRAHNVFKSSQPSEMPSSDRQGYGRAHDVFKSSQLAEMPSSDKQGYSRAHDVFKSSTRRSDTSSKTSEHEMQITHNMPSVLAEGSWESKDESSYGYAIPAGIRHHPSPISPKPSTTDSVSELTTDKEICIEEPKRKSVSQFVHDMEAEEHRKLVPDKVVHSDGRSVRIFTSTAYESSHSWKKSRGRQLETDQQERFIRSDDSDDLEKDTSDLQKSRELTDRTATRRNNVHLQVAPIDRSESHDIQSERQQILRKDFNHKNHALPIPQRKYTKKDEYSTSSFGETQSSYRDDESEFLQNEAAVKIQSVFRGFWVRDCINVDHYCAMVIQKAFRGFMCRVNYQYDRYRVILVQSVWRRSIARSDVAHILACIILVQAVIRGVLGRLKRKAMEQSVIFAARQEAAALTIQCCWRRFWAESILIRTLVDVLISQSIVRGWLARQELKRLKIARGNAEQNVTASDATTSSDSPHAQRLPDGDSEEDNDLIINDSPSTNADGNYGERRADTVSPVSNADPNGSSLSTPTRSVSAKNSTQNSPISSTASTDSSIPETPPKSLARVTQTRSALEPPWSPSSGKKRVTQSFDTDNTTRLTAPDDESDEEDEDEPGFIPAVKRVSSASRGFRDGRPPIPPIRVRSSKLAEKYESGLRQAEKIRKDAVMKSPKKVQVIPPIDMEDSRPTDDIEYNEGSIDDGSEDCDVSAAVTESTKDETTNGDGSAATHTSEVREEMKKRRIDEALKFTDELPNDHPFKDFYKVWGSRGLFHPRKAPHSEAISAQEIEKNVVENVVENQSHTRDSDDFAPANESNERSCNPLENEDTVNLHDESKNSEKAQSDKTVEASIAASESAEVPTNRSAGDPKKDAFKPLTLPELEIHVVAAEKDEDTTKATTDLPVAACSCSGAETSDNANPPEPIASVPKLNDDQSNSVSLEIATANEVNATKENCSSPSFSEGSRSGPGDDGAAGNNSKDCSISHLCEISKASLSDAVSADPSVPVSVVSANDNGVRKEVARFSPITVGRESEENTNTVILSPTQSLSSSGKSVVVYPEGFKLKPSRKSSMDKTLRRTSSESDDSEEKKDSDSLPSGNRIQQSELRHDSSARSVTSDGATDVLHMAHEGNVKEVEKVIAADDPFYSAYCIWYAKGLLRCKPVKDVVTIQNDGEGEANIVN